MKKDNFKRIGNSVFYFFALCILAMTYASANTIAAEKNIEDVLFRKIQAAAGINNLEKVKDDIKRVLKLNPKHTGALFYAGKYCFQTGNFENAEKFLKRVVNDPQYGSKANAVMADIRLKQYNKRFMGTLKVYLTGESFGQALKLCEDALLDMPDNKELLFGAAYASCMLGKKDRAESYAELYVARTDNPALGAELRTLVDAWFTDGFDSKIAIEKFLSIKDKRLLTGAVKRRIKELLISTKSIDRYVDFIKIESQQSGADKDSLERELISFMLEQNQIKQALELINKRPIESLDDNLLYVAALCADNQHIKALDTAKTLMSVAPRDLRVYKCWIEAWLSYTDVNKKVPEGKDGSGTPYTETIERLYDLLRPDKLESQEPELLIDLLRLANFNGDENQISNLQNNVARIAFIDSNEKILLKMADELAAFDRTRVGINILESAVNQLTDNYNVALKLAQLYLEKNPTASIRICEEVMERNPDLLRAFILWCDALNLAGRGGEATSEIAKRLEDETLNEIVKRQLNSKLEKLRMEGNRDKPYTSTPKREEGASFDD